VCSSAVARCYRTCTYSPYKTTYQNDPAILSKEEPSEVPLSDLSSQANNSRRVAPSLGAQSPNIKPTDTPPLDPVTPSSYGDDNFTCTPAFSPLIDPVTSLQYEYADEDEPDFGSPVSAMINPVTPPGDEGYVTLELVGADGHATGEVERGSKEGEGSRGEGERIGGRGG
jgi:hypothetical protein